MLGITEILLGNMSGKISYVGDAVKGVGSYLTNNNTHTITINTTNFTGRVFILGTIQLNPSDNDWFIIPIGEITDYIQFTTDPSQPNFKVTKIFNIIGNYTFLKAKMDRSYLNPPETELTYTPVNITTAVDFSNMPRTLVSGELTIPPNTITTNDNEFQSRFGNIDKIYMKI